LDLKIGDFLGVQLSRPGAFLLGIQFKILQGSTAVMSVAEKLIEAKIELDFEAFDVDILDGCKALVELSAGLNIIVTPYMGQCQIAQDRCVLLFVAIFF
jgi:hypothetical protein